MSINVTCQKSGCGRQFSVPDCDVGTFVYCPKCGASTLGVGPKSDDVPAQTVGPAQVKANEFGWPQAAGTVGVIGIVVFVILLIYDVNKGMAFVDAAIKWGLNPLLWLAVVGVLIGWSHAPKAPAQPDVQEKKEEPFTWRHALSALIGIGIIGNAIQRGCSSNDRPKK